MKNQNSFQYETAFDRNIGWLTTTEQQQLKKSSVAIVGLGGTGGYQAQVLARLGVGQFKIVDPDQFEWTNINRQIGATAETIGRFKADVIGSMVQSINPEAKIDIIREPFCEANAVSILQNVQLAIDGIDFFAIDAKMKLFSMSRQMGLTALTSAPLGFGASLLIFNAASMDPYEYFDIRPEMTEKEKGLALAFGLSPNPLCLRYLKPEAINLDGQRASSVCPGLMLTGAVTGAEAVKILTGKGAFYTAPFVYQIDVFTQKMSRRRYPLGMRGPWMRLKKSLIKKILLKGK